MYEVAVSTIKPIVVTNTSVGPEAATVDGPVVATLLVWPVPAAGVWDVLDACLIQLKSRCHFLRYLFHQKSPVQNTVAVLDPVSRATRAWF